jgi:LysR family transcriptional regulator for metE and metH
MELRHLRLIKTIADEGGITKSLQKLYLTQSAVSHQLRDIEERLGTKIFYRNKLEWHLTEEGKVLYETANKVLADVEGAMTTIQEIKQGEKGSIRFATECNTTYHWLPNFMQKNKVLYPNLDIEIVVEATNNPFQKLLENELDLAIVSNYYENDKLKYYEIFKSEYVVLVHKEHAWAEKKFVLPEDFTTEKLLIHSYPLESVIVYQDFLRLHNQEPIKIQAIPVTEVRLEMVKANMGITCLPLWSLKPFIAAKELKMVKVGKKGLFKTHYAVIRSIDQSKKYIIDFMENLKEELVQ